MLLFITSVRNYGIRLAEDQHDFHYFSNLDKALNYVMEQKYNIHYILSRSSFNNILLDPSVLKIEHRFIGGNTFSPDIVQMSRTEYDIFDKTPLHKVYNFGSTLTFLNEEEKENGYFMEIKACYCD